MKKMKWLLTALYRTVGKRNFLKMKFSLFFILLSVVQLHASVYSQGVKLDIVTNESTLVDFFKQVEKQSDYRFIYNNEDVESQEAVTLSYSGAEIETVMTNALKGTNLSYRIVDNLIIISNQIEAVDEPKPQQEKIRIIGQVLDNETGEGLPGATIVEKGTGYGATTDGDGHYTISVTGPESVLQFSFVGYEPIEKVVGDQKIILVSLKQSVSELDEIVISTGYQKVEKQRMTGSTNTIEAKEITSRGYTSIQQVLEGTVAGLTTTLSGRPGEDAQITIRGVNSLTGSTAPMWIVDGMPLMGDVPNISDGSNDIQSTIFTTGIGNISPDDIKSITVLKDAAATAIYGARAANGVIVVETKSGTVGKAYFNATVNYGLVEKPTSDIRMMNTAQKIQFERDLYADLGRYQHYGRVFDILQQMDYGKYSQKEGEAMIADLGQVQTDWFDEIFRIGNTKQLSMSMRGGTKETQYYASANYQGDKGIEPNNDYEKFGMNMKLTHDPVKNVRITLGLSSTVRKDRSSASAINPLSYALYANPYEKPYNSDGSYAYDLSYTVKESTIRDGVDWDEFNILRELELNTNRSRYLNAQTNLKVEWELLPGLMLTTHGTYSLTSNHNSTEEGADTYTNFINNWMRSVVGEVPKELVLGSLRESTGRSDAFTWRNTISFNKEINDVHFINLFAGQEIYGSKTNNFYNYSPQYDALHGVIGFPEMDGVDATTLSLSSLGGTGFYEERISSFFVNGSYSYADKYIGSFSVRYDGADIIGNKNQFTPLWNVGARWNVHNEGFMQGVNFVNELALRSSYGYTGSIDKNALPFLVLNIGNLLTYDDQVVPTSFNYPNPNIKWQTKQDFNLGLDLALFNNRLELSTEYYHNITRDVLDRQKLAYSSGRGTVTENVADILNEGWEFSLSTTNVKTPDFTWITRFILTLNDNEVLSTYYKSLEEVGSTEQTAFVEGYPVNAWYGYKFAGIDEGTGHTLVWTEDGNKFDMDDISSASNLNLSAPTVSYLGESYPPVTGGLISTFIYKRFTLTANAEFKAGHVIRSFNTNTAVSSKNRYYTDLYRWRQPGDVTMIPAFTGSNNYAYASYLFDTKLERGDYMRISQLTLSYNVDPKFTQKVGFKNIRLSATGRNLYTFTKYNGIDPSLMGGIGYPNTASYTFTVNLGF